MKKDCGALILAGGKSERMGCPKPFLEFHEKTFVEQIIAIYKLVGIQNITVVLNKNHILPIWKKLLRQLQTEVRIIINDNLIEGRFHSVRLGLENIETTDFCFIQNVDNPFISTDVLRLLYKNKIENGYTVPVFENQGGHPILIHRSLATHIRKMEKSERTLREILSKFTRNEIDVTDSRVLININTPADYQKQIFENRAFC